MPLKDEKKNKTNPDIKIFIDFFHEAAVKIKKQRPVFIHGKDGRLVKLALRKLTREQLEQLAVWFLEKKQTLSLTLGAMLSTNVLKTLQEDMKKSSFWAELNQIYDKYFPRATYSKEFMSKFQPFTYKQIFQMQEEIAALERQRKY